MGRSREGWLVDLFAEAEHALGQGFDPAALLEQKLDRTIDLSRIDMAAAASLAAMMRWLGLSILARGDASRARELLEQALDCTHDSGDRATLSYELGLAILLSTMRGPDRVEGPIRFPRTPVFSLLPADVDREIAGADTSPSARAAMRRALELANTLPSRAELLQGPHTHTTWLAAAHAFGQSQSLAASDWARTHQRTCYLLAGLRADTASPRKRHQWLSEAYALAEEHERAGDQETLAQFEKLSRLAYWFGRLPRFPAFETFDILRFRTPSSLSIAQGPWIIVRGVSG